MPFLLEDHSTLFLKKIISFFFAHTDLCHKSMFMFLSHTQKVVIWQTSPPLQLHCCEGGTVESVNVHVTLEEESKVMTL